MAPFKRMRREVQDDDDPDESVRSNADNGEQRKKARQRQQSDDSDSPSEQEDNAPSATSNYPCTQYDRDRDAGFRHLENEHELDERAQMRIQIRGRTIGDNRSADNAIIESITMVNFMNHDRTHLEMGPLINFIVGENGSGKSAALTALIICLGGRASATNRAGNLKSFIKEGKELCNLSVKIKNQGTDAYKPDLFGDSIIIERNFSRSGTSGFKVKSASGRIISTKKADVDDVMEYYQMQVDNPMTILSQDNAKQFLNKAPPDVKYKMFMKGVQLEQLDNDYRIVAETADTMQARIEETGPQLKMLDERKKKARAAVEVVKKNQNMREKEKSLVRKMAWGQVQEEEHELKMRQSELERLEKEREEAEGVVQARDREFEEFNLALERAKEQVSELERQNEPHLEEHHAAKEEYDNAYQDLLNTQREHRQIQESLKAAKAEVKKIEGSTQAELRRIENANGGAHAQKLQKLSDAQDRTAHARTNLAEKSDDSHLQDLLRRAYEDLERAKQPLNAKNNEADQCQQKIRGMSEDANQQLNAFDPKVWRLQKMIDQDKGFREKPIGPIAMYITLLKPMWSNAIERSLGNTSNGFVVTSKADQQRLQNMMRQINLQRCPIIIGNHNPINIQGHEPDESFDTALRVLKIDNDLIRRQLIINQAIEQTILIERRSEAMNTMYNGAKPRNVKQCFTMHDTKRGWGMRLGYAGNTSDASSGPIPPPEWKARMKTNIQVQLQYEKETLEYLKREAIELQQRVREHEHLVQKYQNALTQHKRSKQAAVMELQKAEEAIDRIQEALDKDNVEDGRLEALRIDLQEAQGQEATDTGSFIEAQRTIDKQKQVVSTMKLALDEVKARIAEHDAVIERARGKIHRLTQGRQISLQGKNQAVDALENHGDKIRTAQRLRDDAQQTVDDFIGEATKICEHRIVLEPGMTYKKVENEYHELQKVMEKQRQRQGKSDQQVFQEYEEADKTFETAKAQQDELQELLSLLKQSYIRRLDKWREFQSHISASARMQFTYLLSERGFRGKLTLDHKSKTLTLSVEPDETKRHDKGRATQTLSGGEKSFSNVCLLMSVWDAMGSPLRCLDEFDVYMDSVNRDVTSKLIIGAARRSVGKQFIIISPLAIGGNVERDADVRIHRMKDPRQPNIVQALAGRN